MVTLWIVWAALTLFVISLAIARKVVARREDDLVHLTGSTEPVAQQVSLAEKLDKIDHWGKLLTVVVIVSGVVLFAVMSYFTWQNSFSLEK